MAISRSRFRCNFGSTSLSQFAPTSLRCARSSMLGGACDRHASHGARTGAGAASGSADATMLTDSIARALRLYMTSLGLRHRRARARSSPAANARRSRGIRRCSCARCRRACESDPESGHRLGHRLKASDRHHHGWQLDPKASPPRSPTSAAKVRSRRADSFPSVMNLLARQLFKTALLTLARAPYGLIPPAERPAPA